MVNVTEIAEIGIHVNPGFISGNHDQYLRRSRSEKILYVLQT